MNLRSSPTPAELYEAYLVPGVHARWTPVLLDYAELQADQHVLDAACGTGIVARNVAPRVGEKGGVVALDVNPDMLAVARAQPEPAGAAIEWIEADATALPDGPFDRVLCQQGLQFFPDRPGATREMRRVLRPGGRAVVSVFQGLEHHDLYRALFEAEARYLGVPVEAVASPFSLGDAGELRALLVEAGFHRVEVTPESRIVRFPSPERFVALTLLAAAAIIPESEMDAAARSKMVETIGPEIKDVLRTCVDGDAVVFPMHAHIAVAYA